MPVWARVTAECSRKARRTAARRSRGSSAAAQLGSRPPSYALPIPGEPARRRRHDGASRPRARYRLRLTRPVANFGVMIIRRGRGSRRRAAGRRRAGREPADRVRGASVGHNPYLEEFRAPTLAAGALSPSPASTRVVFDSAARAGAGSFRSATGWTTSPRPRSTLARRRSRADSRFRSRRRTPAQGCTESRSSRPSTARPARDDVPRRRDPLPTQQRSPAGRTGSASASPTIQETKNTENVARILPEHALCDLRLPSSLGLSVAFLDRRERVEVALHGADELLALVVRRDHAKLLLALLPVTILARCAAEAALQARPLHRDCENSREAEQHEPRPAHGRILATQSRNLFKPAHERPASAGSRAVRRRPQ